MIIGSSGIGSSSLIGAVGNVGSVGIASGQSGWSPALCSTPTLVQLSATRATPSVNVIQVTGTRTTATGIDSSNVIVGDFATAFTTATKLVQTNWVYGSKVDTSIANVQPFGITISYIDTVTFLPICEVTLGLREFVGINTGVAIIDSYGGYGAGDVLIDNLSIASGYEIGLFIQAGGAGSASVKDSLGNDFALKFSGAYTSANPLVAVVTYNTGTTLNDSIVGDFNQGSQAFGVTKTGAVSRCNV